MSAGRIDFKGPDSGRWQQGLSIKGDQLELAMAHGAALARAVGASAARIVATPPGAQAEAVWIWDPATGWRHTKQKTR